MYTCGPTVYFYPHIGNWRTFVFYDLLRRALTAFGFQVTQVMNATDVGHLTGDNLGDADLGEDRFEQEAKRERKTVWEIAQFYLEDFLKTRDFLNILPPTHFVRATDHIREQVALIERLLAKGLVYETATGVFFDVSKFPTYGKLGGQKLIDKRVRVRAEAEADTTKRHPVDFAVWFKTVGKRSDHVMRWPSPWGEGFPGWHLECSAMALRYLGETLDIHAGGVDLIALHHTNEIAQSEGATGKPFARYWMHGEFLLVDGGRMGKSLGNAYTLHDVQAKGFDPLALRYFYLNAHYRTPQNFTWEALGHAQKALLTLRQEVSGWEEGGEVEAVVEEEFRAALADDLNLPQALVVVWGVVKSSLPVAVKRATLLRFDEVLGLGLRQVPLAATQLHPEVRLLLQEREAARAGRDWAKADKLRRQIEEKGFLIEDTQKGPRLKRQPSV